MRKFAADLTVTAAACIGLSLAMGASFVTPPEGQFCPPGFSYDSANCFLLKASPSSQPLVSDNQFVYNPSSGEINSQSCIRPGFGFASGKCNRQVPAGYVPFVFNDGFYVQSNGHFVKEMKPLCPPGGQWDTKNCFFGAPPGGRNASISGGWFAFEKDFLGEICAQVLSGAIALDPFHCGFAKVPAGYNGFVWDNKWYTEAHMTPSETWLVRHFVNDSSDWNHQVCRADGPPRTWTLAWSEDFAPQPDNQKCYKFNDDILRCVNNPYGGVAKCDNSPPDWTDSAYSSQWSPDQKTQFGGVRDLDKCRWEVLDTFNRWDVDWNATTQTWVPPVRERMSSFKPQNVTISGGLLTMKTRSHPTIHNGDGYDCGRQTEPDFLTTGSKFTKECPYSGAMITSETWLPATQANDPNGNNPDYRYVGRAVSFGRIEFRARITRLGHGAVLALWLYADVKQTPSEPNGELDVLEFLADMAGPTGNADVEQGVTDQIKKQSATYGMAWQTANDWKASPPISQTAAIPIGLGAWRVYAVEWEPTEVRFYIDGCLRNRLLDGQLITNPWTGITKPYNVPKNQLLNILIGVSASANLSLTRWYRAYQKATDVCGNGEANCSQADAFEATELQVDYIKFYTSTDFPQFKPPSSASPSRIEWPYRDGIRFTRPQAGVR